MICGGAGVCVARSSLSLLVYVCVCVCLLWNETQMSFPSPFCRSRIFIKMIMCADCASQNGSADMRPHRAYGWSRWQTNEPRKRKLNKNGTLPHILLTKLFILFYFYLKVENEIFRSYRDEHSRLFSHAARRCLTSHSAPAHSSCKVCTKQMKKNEYSKTERPSLSTHTCSDATHDTCLLACPFSHTPTFTKTNFAVFALGLAKKL